MGGINWAPDKVSSISSATGRLVVDGTRAVEVRADSSSKAQIAALLDLLDLHLSQADAGQPVAPGQVTLRVPRLTSEARGALGTLSQSLLADLRVNVLEQDASAQWTPTSLGWDQADVGEYRSWPDLLKRPRSVPSMVTEIVSGVNDPAFRAYPMLSTRDGWSLRLEGLEVARVARGRVTLKVGRDGKTGGRSLQRAEWIVATGHSDPVATGDAAVAVEAITSFALAWHGLADSHGDQDEHALESRILRGATPITVNGEPLSLLQSDAVVNWGSQFPTKWGPGGDSRYLDALMRDGSTPWAIEMKVQGGAGVGQYYRHAVAQAVLYREFIRQATPLHFWFEERGLSASACEAAVVVPEVTNPRHARWREHVARLCEAFGLAFVEVDPSHALRH